MNPTSRWAYKEWAAVCEALTAGRQTILLRKGGIHEGPDGFQVEHSGFWLFATRYHQSPDDLSESGRPFLDQANAASPPAGMVKLPAFARIDSIHWIDAAARLPELSPFHILSLRTIAERFDYRTPGLYVLITRIHVASEPLLMPDSPHFAGCRTWVDLPCEVSAEGLQPALREAAYRDVRREIERAIAGVRIA